MRCTSCLCNHGLHNGRDAAFLAVGSRAGIESKDSVASDKIHHFQQVEYKCLRVLVLALTLFPCFFLPFCLANSSVTAPSDVFSFHGWTSSTITHFLNYATKSMKGLVGSVGNILASCSTEQHSVELHDCNTQPFWQARLIDVALWSIHETSVSLFKAWTVCLLTMDAQTKLWFMVMLYLTATFPWQSLGICSFTYIIIKVSHCFSVWLCRQMFLVFRVHITAKPWATFSIHEVTNWLVALQGKN